MTKAAKDSPCRYALRLRKQVVIGRSPGRIEEERVQQIFAFINPPPSFQNLPRSIHLLITTTELSRELSISTMSSRWDSPNNEASSSASAAAAAAAAAAKIAAQFASKAQPSSSSKDTDTSAPHSKERDEHDAEFTHDIEINDQRNRYMLTKGQTQQQIHRETGASVTTKGTWYPDKALATKEDPPLYLHVSAISQDILDAAIAKINELMAQEVPQLVEDRHQRRLDYENQRPPPRERRRWPEEKVPVNLESIRNFNVRSKIVGPGGMFVKYIQSETGTRVQIKGLGSGFIESDTGVELPEPMHIAIAGPEDEQIKAARALVDDLMEVVRSEWQKAYDSMGQGYGGGQRGGYGGYDGGAQRGGGYGRSQGYGRGGSPMGAGGYGQHQQQQQGGWDQQRGWNQQQQSYPYSRHNGDPAPPPTDDGAPPPPPPEDDAPPPPPADSASHRPSSQRGTGASQHASSPTQSRSQPAATAAAKSPEEEALDKYWREYVTWEDSFKAYHNRMPTKEEGGQDVPPQYRK